MYCLIKQILYLDPVHGFLIQQTIYINHTLVWQTFIEFDETIHFLQKQLIMPRYMDCLCEVGPTTI